MFAKFYQSELTYLREMGREFAAANPASAGLLSERSDDPDVERLLEGFAFLTSRIQLEFEKGYGRVAKHMFVVSTFVPTGQSPAAVRPRVEAMARLVASKLK